MDTAESKTASRDKLVNDLKVLVADADDYVRVSARQAGELYGATRARLEATLASLRTQLGESTRVAARAVDGCVHRNPWQSIALGAFTGLLLGLLIGRR
jgi:ElaB/YqjD/DUF883 family membrane-anchored ribosome-binding protein